MAYDATRVLAAAMERGVTADEIKDGLYNLKDYPGVSGNITFDKNGDAVSRLMSVMVVKDGKFQDYK
jgi:branched-chain amino acid transport system substrate-binding protein